jgi:hypothetical protein
MTSAQKRLLDSALIWHAARVISGARSTKADEFLHKKVAAYLKVERGRRKR